MKKIAKLSSKNQITVPAAVRASLGLKAGERVVFDVDTSGTATMVTLRRYPTLDELAGSIPTPSADAVGLTWEEIRARAWTPPNRHES